MLMAVMAVVVLMMMAVAVVTIFLLFGFFALSDAFLKSPAYLVLPPLQVVAAAVGMLIIIMLMYRSDAAAAAVACRFDEVGRCWGSRRHEVRRQVPAATAASMIMA